MTTSKVDAVGVSVGAIGRPTRKDAVNGVGRYREEHGVEN